MSTRVLNAFAALLLLLAIGGAAGAFHATNASGDIQGPSALAVLPDRSVWVSVEDALWHLDADGKRIAVVDAATLGVGGLIGNLVVHPTGQLVAQVRGDPTLYFLDPETARIKSRLVPQWQSDLGDHASNAINYVFNDDGRVAIATGGGHAVALFDANGRFLGRTRPGTYKFTNGLWWAAGRLWTTDTNRQELVELDGKTLTEKSRVKLSWAERWQYLGMAVPSHGQASEKTHTLPLATLIRFANGMIEGHATDVFSDGSQLDYPAIGSPEPRDIKWRGNELLLVDGASFSIKRYADDRTPLADFGDAQVRAELAASLARRDGLDGQYHACLGGAIILFIIGFAFAWRAQAQEKSRTLASLKVDLSRLGTPVLSTRVQLLTGIKIFWPIILVVGIYPLIKMRPDQTWPSIRPASMELFLVSILASTSIILATLVLIGRNIRRALMDQATEPFFNQGAVRFLQSDVGFWELRQPDELPLETLILGNEKGRARPIWLVLTNRRLLVFVTNVRDRTLLREYPRNEILRLQIAAAAAMTWQQKLQKFLMASGEAVRFEFRDGTSLAGFTVAAQAARRMAAWLESTPADTAAFGSESRAQHAPDKPRATGTQDQRAVRQAVASLLIPGLGQWMQRRSGAAFIFFVIWLAVLMIAIPVAFVFWKSLAEVTLQTILLAAEAYVMVCLWAAWDTWQVRTRSRK